MDALPSCFASPPFKFPVIQQKALVKLKEKVLKMRYALLETAPIPNLRKTSIVYWFIREVWSEFKVEIDAFYWLLHMLGCGAGLWALSFFFGFGNVYGLGYGTCADTGLTLLSRGGVLFMIANMRKHQVPRSPLFWVSSYAVAASFAIMGHWWQHLFLNTTYKDGDTYDGTSSVQMIFHTAMLFVAASLSGWHIHATLDLCRKRFYIYFFSNITILAYWAIQLWLPFYETWFEIHYSMIFWLLALFCRVNHPVSKVALGIFTGASLQGLYSHGPASRWSLGAPPVPMPALGY
jgi:hypothetical protein